MTYTITFSDVMSFARLKIKLMMIDIFLNTFKEQIVALRVQQKKPQAVC